MTTPSTLRPPVAAGEPAPDFALPAVADAATVSLGDYRGRSPLFLALMLGLWCPFCRRTLVQLGTLEGRLKALGVESLAVVATEPEHARVYFKFRPTRLRLAADPGLTIHRAYRVPKPEPTPEMMAALAEARVNPFGEFPEPLPVEAAAKLLAERDGYVCTPIDQADTDRQWPQLKALFMIDRAGIVRWAEIECQSDGFAGLGRIPSDAAILDAASLVLH